MANTNDFRTGRHCVFALHVHLIFVTKYRRKVLSEAAHETLHALFARICQDFEARLVEANGEDDHVHLLVGLKSTHCLADVVRELKKAASIWVHEEIGMSCFAWQEGYAAFTVSPSARDAAKDYIANQEAHHERNRSAKN